jgi:cytochrome c biogenesis protein CcmG, thiol:disulfide interchange protein DsbE
MMAHGTVLTRSLAGIVAIATIAGCGSAVHSAAPSKAQLAADLKGSPSPLAALHRQANQLLDGGASALRARLRALRGYPVVVTQWASWCTPCRAEFPYFQQLSAQLGRRVAFIGNDASDTTANARNWLQSFPVSFPSYRDPSGQVALALSPYYALDTPVTYLYTRSGVQYSNVGPYASEQALRRQIRADLGV